MQTQLDQSRSEGVVSERSDLRPGAPERLFTPAFIALSLAELAYFTAEGLSIPVTPLFAAGPLGASELGVGVAVGAFSVTALLLRPIAGRLADRRGRRPLLIGGALAYAAVMAAHSVTTDLGVLFGLRLLLGAAEAFFFVAGFAAVADLAPPNRSGEALSLNSLSLYLGIAIGPLLGEVLLREGNFAIAWLGGSALALTAAVLASRIPETATAGSAEDGPLVLVHPAAVGPGLGLLAGIGGMAGFLAFVALYARDLGMEGSGLVLLVFGGVVIGCRVVFARLPDRVPPFRLGAAALGVSALGLVVAASVHSPAGLILGAATLGVGVAFTTPAFFTAIVARTRPSERGAAMGTASVFLDLAFGGGPMLLGVVAGAAGIPWAFAVAAVVAAAGAVGVALLGRGDQLRHSEAVTDAEGMAPTGP
jgi:predicted MFS family arabinose efflux permease